MSNLIVSIIIPCYNEEKFIAKCLESLLNNDIDKESIEIIIVDGMSKDKTREIIKEYCSNYKFITLVDNPHRIKPIALNIGIQKALSEIIMRVDAHCIYSSNYVSGLVKYLDDYNADNVGGVRVTDLGHSIWENAIGIALSHPFTAGNAYWRMQSENIDVKYVDTVFCGCYRRSVFDRIGLFNENLIRTQDRELNLRLKSIGGKILLCPEITCTYFPRTKLSEYWKWLYNGGMWLVYAQSFTGVKMIAPRHLAPLMLVLLYVVSFVSLFLPDFLSALKFLLLFLLFIYWVLNFFYSISVSLSRGNALLFFFMFFLFPCTHIAYGFGELHGSFSFLAKEMNFLKKSTNKVNA